MFVILFFKQKTAYEMRISDWSSDVCSSDLCGSQQNRLSRRTKRDRRGYLVKRSALQPVGQLVGVFFFVGQHAFEHAAGGRVLVADDLDHQIGRASCRESGCQYV